MEKIHKRIGNDISVTINIDGVPLTERYVEVFLVKRFGGSNLVRDAVISNSSIKFTWWASQQVGIGSYHILCKVWKGKEKVSGNFVDFKQAIELTEHTEDGEDDKINIRFSLNG